MSAGASPRRTERGVLRGVGEPGRRPERKLAVWCSGDPVAGRPAALIRRVPATRSPKVGR